jgi:hypothetical protein
MRARSRSLSWHGQTFRFEYAPTPQDARAPLWAVSRRGEFIGMMACSPEVTTKDFDIRGMRWLDELLGGVQGSTGTR